MHQYVTLPLLTASPLGTSPHFTTTAPCDTPANASRVSSPSNNPLRDRSSPRQALARVTDPLNVFVVVKQVARAVRVPLHCLILDPLFFSPLHHLLPRRIFLECLLRCLYEQTGSYSTQETSALAEKSSMKPLVS